MIRALVVLLALSGAALAADTTPFYPMAMPGAKVRPYRMVVTTTATQYPVMIPPGATSFWFTNPCSVDVRLDKAANAGDAVTMDTGRLIMARSAVVMATVSPAYVSVMAMSDPGAAGCIVEMQYGTGN
jgi:hypothetical protein